MIKKKKRQQTAMRFLAATLAVSNLLGASAAAGVLPEGYAAYSEEGLAAVLQDQMDEPQTAQDGTDGGSGVLPTTEQKQDPDNEVDSQADEEQEPSNSRATDTVTVSKTDGDNAVWYSGSTEKYNSFTFEADVSITEGSSAGLVYGIQDKNSPLEALAAGNVNFSDAEGRGMAHVFGFDVNYDEAASLEGFDGKQSLHLKFEVNETGAFIYTVTQGEQTAERKGTLKNWQGGYVGFLTWNSAAEFSNITLTGENIEVEPPVIDPDALFIGEGVTVNEDGSIAVDKTNGDHFAMYNGLESRSNAFTMEVDVNITEGDSAALVFGAANKTVPVGGWSGANVNYNDNNFRVFGGVNPEPQAPIEKEDRTRLHLKLEMETDGRFVYSFGEQGAEPRTLTGQVGNWRGGYVGLLTFNSAATFTNFQFTDRSEFGEEDAGTVDPLPETCIVHGTDFRSLRPDLVETTDKAVHMQSSGGDHFVIYNGMEEKTKAFVLEADVKLMSSDEPHLRSAALVFGIGSKKLPTLKWGGANVDTSRENGADAFRVFGGSLGLADTNYDGEKGDIDFTKPLHFRLEVKENGDFIYHFGNADTPEEDYVKRAIRGNIPNWTGGYVGLLSFKTEAEFTDIRFRDNDPHTVATGTPVEVGGGWNTNLHDLTAFGGEWESTADGLHSAASGQGDCFLYSQARGSNFVYSTDVTFHSDEGAAALLFRNRDTNGNEECYAVNLDAASRKCKLWRWSDGTDYQLMNESPAIPEAETDTLKVVALGPWLSCYVNDTLVASSGDYTLPHQYDDKGQNTVLKDGCFGLLNFNGDVTFQNTRYTDLTDAFTPLLKELRVTSSTGTVEKRTQFVPTEPITIQYVKNDVSTVRLNALAQNASAVVTITDEDGNTYASGADIPVKVGKNWLTVTSKVRASDGTEAAVTYRVDVHRRQPDEVYYNEPYRGQYHYSVQDGWANDPNGMVYFNGKYHLFYQFYDDVEWGPMHWAHAVSTDLLHWTEEPIAFYPDANGAMFSGCIVADTRNESGFFDGVPGGGLVALITADGGGQRIKLAYSADEGTTWTKVDEIAADWTDDPLADSAFRDPKVFRWENQWFMVVAGGPLRIYSSKNLREWKCETPYGDLHTECPDLYPIQLEDGTIKWVLSRGGRFYKIGDFTNRNGKWEFIPDADYRGNRDGAETNGVMNFGDDSYAAMTYFVQDFGTSANPQIPTITEINWMNTWADNYCRRVTQASGEKFNGTFNLNLDLGLTEENGKYLLTQTPVRAYESLRDTENAVVIPKTAASEANAQIADFRSDCYEIIAKFKPLANETVGFNVRVGGGKKTSVLYDSAQKTMTIDRSQSGRMIPDAAAFSGIDKQENVELNADGTMDMHIFVDRACVELFAKNNTVLGANQIFPEAGCLGLEVVGDGAEVELTIYPMNSIWMNTVTFDANGGTASASSQKTGTDGRLTSLPSASRSGYRFTGWYLPDGSLVTTDTVFTSAVTVTAGWAPSSSGSSSGGSTHPSRPSGGDSSSDRKPSDTSGKKDTERTDAKPAPTPAEETNHQPADTSGYRDVPITEWFAPAVNYVTANGIMTGNGNLFSPNEKLTRGMMAQILYNMAGGSGSGSANFPDVASSDWFANAVGWTAERGYIGGYSNGKFGANDPITREQLAAILYRYAQANGLTNGPSAELTSFVDASATSDWAEEAVRWAVGAGLLSGKSGGRLDPAGQATRAEVAQILTNFSQNIAR